jgi:23S rRNA (adenine2503-C2)-methyltransferase
VRFDLRPQLKDYPLEELSARFERAGVAAYRAQQVHQWLYGRGVDDPHAMTDLAMDLRSRLASEWRSRALELEGLQRSVDGTLKGRLRAVDGAEVEAVAIPEDERTTLCISTQVGCPLACSFCATGALGFERNLSTAEIVDQLVRMRAVLDPGRRITNVVFMGMGEPLLNLPAVLRAVRILMHPKGFGFAGRRITVSTAGVVPRLRELVANAPVNLAVSLHATTDALRDVLVPLNRRFPLHALIAELRSLEQITPRRPVFFEYTLMRGVNDALDDARRLVRLLKDLPSKVNVIPMNPHPDAPYEAPEPEQASRFLGELARAGLTVTLRRNRGADIDAACGQLARRAPAQASVVGSRLLRPGPTRG